jgi:dimethylamine/trimethylamine dehydrogenase
MPNVSVYPGSPMTADDVLEAGGDHVIVATGATWRRDGIGRGRWRPIPGYDSANVYTPDDIMADRLPSGRVVVFDNDHFYLGGVIAERLARDGCQVVMVTPAPMVSIWTEYTLEQERIQRRLTELGVSLHTQRTLAAIHPDAVSLSCTVSGAESELACDAVVLLTDRLPNETLYQALKPKLAGQELKTLRVIGDAEAPNIIAQAVFAGHLAAREFGEAPVDGTPFRIERVGNDS